MLASHWDGTCHHAMPCQQSTFSVVLVLWEARKERKISTIPQNIELKCSIPLFFFFSFDHPSSTPSSPQGSVVLGQQFLLQMQNSCSFLKPGSSYHDVPPGIGGMHRYDRRPVWVVHTGLSVCPSGLCWYVGTYHTDNRSVHRYGPVKRIILKAYNQAGLTLTHSK